MKTKLSGKILFAVTLFSLIGQVAWVVENMYFNVFIYKMFAASPSDIAAMVAASAVTATLTTVFMGALSDKIGKRKTFMYTFFAFSVVFQYKSTNKSFQRSFIWKLYFFLALTLDFLVKIFY